MSSAAEGPAAGAEGATADDRPGRVYKVFRPGEWAALEADGVTRGSADDRASGFVHFSTAAQLPGTLARHFAGEAGLILVAAETARFGADLGWERSRGGALFPHLYRPLARDELGAPQPIALGADGRHILPDPL